MNDGVKIALIAAAGLIVAVCLYIYFSPYQTCVRATTSEGTVTEAAAQMWCARNSK